MLRVCFWNVFILFFFLFHWHRFFSFFFIWFNRFYTHSVEEITHTHHTKKCLLLAYCLFVSSQITICHSIYYYRKIIDLFTSMVVVSMDSNAHNWRFIFFFHSIFGYFCRWLHGISIEIRLIAVFFCTFAASVSLVCIWLVGAAAAFVMDFNRSCCTHSNFSSISYFRRAPYFALTLSFRSHTGLCLSRLCCYWTLEQHTLPHKLDAACLCILCVWCLRTLYLFPTSPTPIPIPLLASRPTLLSLCNRILCMRYSCKRCSSQHSLARMLLSVCCVCVRIRIRIRVLYSVFEILASRYVTIHSSDHHTKWIYIKNRRKNVYMFVTIDTSTRILDMAGYRWNSPSNALNRAFSFFYICRTFHCQLQRKSLGLFVIRSIFLSFEFVKLFCFLSDFQILNF